MTLGPPLCLADIIFIRWYRPSLCMTGMALGDIGHRFAWQVWHLWHLWHWIGFGGTLGPQWSPVVAAAAGVADLTLTDVDRYFAWQVWYLRHWTDSHVIFDPPLSHIPSFTYRLSHAIFHAITLRGRYNTCGAGLILAPSLTHNFIVHYLYHTSSFTHPIFHTQLCHTPSLTLYHLPTFTHHFVTHHRNDRPLSPWQAWYLVISTVFLRGRRGTWRRRPSFCVAGVALMTLDWLRWRAWAAVAARWPGNHTTW